MSKVAAVALSCVLIASLGCHSAFVVADVRNRTQQPLNLLELDYPSASFGTQTLAPGADLKYRFKVLGSDTAKLVWINSAQIQMQTIGPELSEGDEGTFVVTVEPAGVHWTAEFKNRTLAPVASSPQPLMMPK
jgi:hypothetical protein